MEKPPQDGWKRSEYDPRRVVVTFSVTTTAVWAVLLALVGFVSNQEIIFGSNTRLKECPQTQGTESADRLQARMMHLYLRRASEKPTDTLEGAGIRISQHMSH
jgi:hypothetical protein